MVDVNYQILIVDDQPVVRDVLRRMLEGSGYQVIAAANGREAIRKLGEDEYHLVISDILMPELDGLELIVHLRKQKPDIKIIAISGASNQRYLDWARRLGASRIIEKPFTTRTVTETVSELLGRNP